MTKGTRNVATGLIFASVIAGIGWLLRSALDSRSESLPPRYQHASIDHSPEQPIPDRQQVNTEPNRSTEIIEPANPNGAVGSSLAQDPQIELPTTVHEMLLTLTNKGYEEFANKYVYFAFVPPSTGKTMIYSNSDQLGPELKAMGFGDINQVLSEVEAIQNVNPRYLPSSLLGATQDPIDGHMVYDRTSPRAFYDLPKYPGGPKQFELQYSHGKWTILGIVRDVW